MRSSKPSKWTASNSQIIDVCGDDFLIFRSKVSIPAKDLSHNSGSLDKVSMMKGINLEELIFKGLKRIKDLIDRPVDRKSTEELEKRLSEINVSK